MSTVDSQARKLWASEDVASLAGRIPANEVEIPVRLTIVGKDLDGGKGTSSHEVSLVLSKRVLSELICSLRENVSTSLEIRLESDIDCVVRCLEQQAAGKKELPEEKSTVKEMTFTGC